MGAEPEHPFHGPLLKAETRAVHRYGLQLKTGSKAQQAWKSWFQLQGVKRRKGVALVLRVECMHLREDHGTKTDVPKGRPEKHMLMKDFASCGRQSKNDQRGGTKQVGPSRWDQAGGTKQVGPSRWDQAGGTKQVGPSRWGKQEIIEAVSQQSSSRALRAQRTKIMWGQTCSCGTLAYFT
jgi:hypothetical protein